MAETKIHLKTYLAQEYDGNIKLKGTQDEKINTETGKDCSVDNSIITQTLLNLKCFLMLIKLERCIYVCK